MKTYEFPTLGIPSAAPVTLAFIALFLMIVTALPTGNLWPNAVTKKPDKHEGVKTDCPYEYILSIYGKHHFAALVKKLAPKMERSDPQKWQTILDIMDAVHLCLILIDDITDSSHLRKGLPAAHTLFGASETSLRAYLSLVRTVNETMKVQPQMVPAVVSNLEDILTGQDMSLVWRRDGLASLPSQQEDRMEAYRKSASLKTGSLFRLLGQLVFEDRSYDDLMTRVGWYSQLQNDCKNIYSKDYAKAKGALAEDLRNGEFSYPIVLALGQPDGNIVERALKSRSEANVKQALRVVRRDEVKGACLAELRQVGGMIGDFVEIWGRKEAME